MIDAEILENLDKNESYLFIMPAKLVRTFLLDINKLDGFYDIKIKTREDILKEAYFEITNSAFLDIAKSYYHNYSTAEEILSNFYIAASTPSTKGNLMELKAMINYLMDKGSVKSVLAFSFVRKAYIIGYNLDKLFLRALQKTKIDYQIISNKKLATNFLISSYNNTFDEVTSAFHYIANLIDSGVNINDIKIHYTDHQYTHYLKSIATHFGIPIISTLKIPLISFPLAIKIVNHPLIDLESIEQLILDEGPESNYYINEFITFLNDYNRILLFTEPRDRKNLITYIFKNILFYQDKFFPDYLIAGDMKSSEASGKYLVALGANQDSFVTATKDNNFFTDQELQDIFIDTKFESNELAKKNMIDLLYSYPEVYISYLNNSLPSSVLKLLPTKPYLKPANNKTFSPLVDEIALAKKIDTFIAYNTKENNFDILMSSYPHLVDKYLSFNNIFKGLNEETTSKLLTNYKVNLSSTSLTNFFKCQFRYLTDNLLKINKYQPTIEAELGTFFHEILKQIYQENINIKDLIKNELDKFYATLEPSAKNNYYKSKYNDIISNFVFEILEQSNASDFKPIYLEKDFLIELDSKYQIGLYGKIDKIATYESDDKKHFIIVDYKSTKAPNIKMKHFNFGFDIQLFIYIYLFTNYYKYPLESISGFYYQVLMNSRPKKNKLKPVVNNPLIGFTTDSEEIIEHIDKNYQNPETYLKSLRLNKYSLEELNEYIEIVDKHIKVALLNIESGNFAINPKSIDYESENLSCDYCQNYDICCRSIQNIEILKVEEEEDGAELD